MIKEIAYKISNTRFFVYVVLLTIMALTAHAFIPPSSSLSSYAPFVKFMLLPFPALLLIKGVKHRFPDKAGFVTHLVFACYAGIVGSTLALHIR